jgi:pilus assembly protein CpaC
MSTQCRGHRSWRHGTRQVLHETTNLLALLVLLCCASLYAPPVAATEDLPATNSKVINLMVGQGRLLRFDGPVDSVFIADSSLADLRVVSPDVVYVYGKKSGTTNLIAVSKDLSVRSTAEFRVSTDPRPANDTRQALQPTSTVDISIFGTRAAATGRTHRIEEATDVENVVETYTPPGQPPINNTTIADTQQVNIRVRFAEVSRNDLQSLGFDWKVFASLGNFGTGGKVDIDLLIKALQDKGVLTILAEPNLTAVTGQSASFLAGGEIPIPVPQTTGLMTVQYKPFGVSLEFTPTIIKTNRIALRVRPEVSALSRAGSIKMSGVELPSLTVRRADTTVEVASGQTFAIAGLFERQLSDDLSQIAGLGDIPVLGELFRSTRYRRDETELVILITPFLVKPVRDRAVATPLDHPAPPPLPRRRPEAQQLGYSLK